MRICFGLNSFASMKCNEAAEEEISKSVEKFYQLSCFIEKGKSLTYFLCLSLEDFDIF